MGLEALQLVLGLERHTEFAGRCGLYGNMLLPAIPHCSLAHCDSRLAATGGGGAAAVFKQATNAINLKSAQNWMQALAPGMLQEPGLAAGTWPIAGPSPATPHPHPPRRVWATSFADVDSYEVFAGFPQQDQAALLRMLRGGQMASLAGARAAIIVCHSEPGAWALPEPLYQTALCPPVSLAQAARVVARAMFETDRLSAEHVRR